MLIFLSALVGGALLLTLSRGGIAAFVGGQCLFVLLRVVTRLKERNTDLVESQHLAWLPIGLTLTIALGLFTAQDAIIGEFVGGTAKKLDLALEGLPLAGRFWTTGVGRGAFWVAFPLVSDFAAKTTFTHAENAVVQILADYGVVIGGAALVGMAMVVGKFLLQIPNRVEQAAVLAALTAFGIHNLLDFNMEIPGVAVVAVALLGVLSGSANQPAPGYRKRSRRIPRTVVALTAAASLGAAVFIGYFQNEHSIDEDERHYATAWSQRNPAPFSKEKLSAVLRRHPADWYIPFLVGVRLFHTSSDNPLPWFSRALELNSASASAHLYVGRTLLRAENLDQAMLELRLASRFNPALAFPIAEFLVESRQTFKELSPLPSPPSTEFFSGAPWPGCLSKKD